MHRPDYPIYKYMNTGSGVYRKNINSKDLGASCWIWVGLILVIGLVCLIH